MTRFGRGDFEMWTGAPVIGALLCALLFAASPAPAQDRRAAQQQRIDVQGYVIDATINPQTQTITATAKVTFIPIDNVSNISFELNNALDLNRVTDADGSQLSASRYQEDNSVRISLPRALERGKPTTLTFVYGGKLTGQEESPVFGIKFAAITPDVAYLMYPSRWFPVNDYTIDRFTCDMKVTVPEGYAVVASGNGVTVSGAPSGMRTERYQFTQASFPGSIAVVHGDPRVISADGVSTSFFFRQGAEMASAYGSEFARAMTFFTDAFGLPYRKNLTVVETDNGAPNAYAAPGVVFLSPKGIGKQVALKLVANSVARQWWGALLSPATRNHMWIEDGMARYSEIMYLEHVNGAGAGRRRDP